MTELENLRLALLDALTMPLDYCDDARDRAEAIADLQRRIAQAHRRELIRSRKRYAALLDDFAAEVRRDRESEQRGSYNGRQ